MPSNHSQMVFKKCLCGYQLVNESDDGNSSNINFFIKEN